MRCTRSTLAALALSAAACDGSNSVATNRAHDPSVPTGGTSSTGTDSGSGGSGGRGDASTSAGGASGAMMVDAGRVDAAAGPVNPPSFRKIVLTTTFYAEGACYGDFDRNGTTDVMSGPFWYEGPAFTTKHSVYAATAFDPHRYSDNFLEFARDFDADGYPDVLVVNYPGRDAAVYVNSKNPDVAWARHAVYSAVSVESPAFVDITGDGNPELVFAYGNRLGWAGPSATAPLQTWTFHGASTVGAYPVFTHGLGVGDINRDGRLDILEMGGAWIQPASLAGDPAWTKMPATFGSGGAQMFAYDVDGDGDNDVITSLAAHGYGIAWFEQRTNSGVTTFVEHLVATNDPGDAASSPLIHEPHALDLKDVDGDGLSDVVTGERFWGHVPAGSPDVNGPAPLYWFSLERTPAGAHFTPHLVDGASGVGTQVVAADVNDDGLVDIVTGNKKGAFVFLQERR